MQNKFRRLLLLLCLVMMFLVPSVAQNTITSLVLTSSTPPSVAYSLCKLNSSYTVSLMRNKNSKCDDLYKVWLLEKIIQLQSSKINFQSSLSGGSAITNLQYSADNGESCVTLLQQ